MDKAYKIWIKRAKSSLILSMSKKTDDIYYEDLCFDAQQAAEKALKALIIFLGLEPPKTHSFNSILLELEKKIQIPEKVKNVLDLNDYAVQTRYPGDYQPIDEEEYNNAIEVAEYIYNWVIENLKL